MPLCGHCGIVTNNSLCISCAQAEMKASRGETVAIRRRPAVPVCGKCRNGVIETGNNDLPCDCPLGDTARFNTVDSAGRGVTISGAALRQTFVPQRNPAAAGIGKVGMGSPPKAPKKPEPPQTRLDFLGDRLDEDR